ncbi:MAG: hypothetical protein KA477_00195 [Candidatus Levybacteria bacterium]|nr:hypothetical protein [Candidatus Levybacteria bacterium]
MRYPWVCLSIFGVYTAGVIIQSFDIVSSTTLYVYITITVLVMFMLGYARG